MPRLDYVNHSLEIILMVDSSNFKKDFIKKELSAESCILYRMLNIYLFSNLLYIDYTKIGWLVLTNLHSVKYIAFK